MNKLIINTFLGAKSGGFLEKHFSEQLQWHHVDCQRLWWHERTIRKPDLSRWRAALQTAVVAGRRASLVVSHDPHVTFACETLLRSFSYNGLHLAFSFNFPTLPSGVRLRMMRRAFRSVDRFLVYSTAEREIYHNTFDIPADKISFIHWSVNPPTVNLPDKPLVAGDYICAIGGNARDYYTLVEAARGLPDVPLVVVARPHNFSDIKVPSNVSVKFNLPLGDTMNVLAHSKFMVLPLAGGEVPCGHVTVVHAMHLGKAVVATDSTGLSDYVQDDVTGLTCPSGQPEVLAHKIRQLWDDQLTCARLGGAGRSFATTHCTEAHTVEWFRSYLLESQLPHA